ncbi:MFS transporter [Sphingobium sp. TA15]|uniref:MFS transporter permease n=3 Tax=Sphingobium indicum TaxID=332055 RepID=A0A8E0WQF7_9SPHN|nr:MULTISPECIES: MFS transporter [Sphingobium]EPR15252.1 MFS transporter permease [Sphingobium indicum IP26]BDD68768.1 MFS transporter [Sphingobium sp. TA15]EQB03012.1 MFS transporter permease [Sphingobium sp. HDIP04]KER35523.1 MFS transporter permease [Sphingobium indicum F2]NYI23528.1 MFS family permease [Sphingobium indicum]
MDGRSTGAINPDIGLFGAAGEAEGEAELRHGWPIILVAFLGITVGISSTFLFSTGLFLKPVADAFGWGRGTVSIAPFVASMLTALCAPFVGRCVDRFGVLPVLLPSLLGLAAGLLLLGMLSADFFSYVALMALVALLGAGTAAPVITKMIIAGFKRRRGLALGLSLAGSGLGGGLIPLFLTPIIAAHGWRAGYMALAGIELAGFAVIGALIWLWRRTILPPARPTGARVPRQEAAVSADGPPLLRDRTFLLLALAFFLSAWGILTTVVHFVPMLTDAGVDATRAAGMAGTIGAALIFGRIVVGYLLDRLPAVALAQCLFAMVAAGMLTLVAGGAHVAVVALIAAIAAGIGIGSENDIMSFLVGRYYATSRFGSVNGALFAVFLVGGSIGPAASGYMYDATGSYTLALLLSAGALVTAALLLFALPKLPSSAASG